MNDGLIFLDKFVNIIAKNNRAEYFLDAKDGIVACGKKLRFEDKVAFSTLLMEIYFEHQTTGKQREWYASRPSKSAPYKIKLFLLDEFRDNNSLNDIFSLLVISESDDIRNKNQN